MPPPLSDADSAPALDEQLKVAEVTLQQILFDFDLVPTSAPAYRYNLLRLQAAIFHYDVVYDFAAFSRAAPEGFAEKVALKNLVNKIFEYEQQLQRLFIKETVALAENRNIEINDYVKAERKKWEEAFRMLQGWATLRNRATSHYDPDIKAQVDLLLTIEREKVVYVAHAFLHYNMAVLRVLATVGGNKVHGIQFSKAQRE